MGLKQATKLAEKSECYKYKLGAVIKDRWGETISTGWNKRKTHPTQHRHATAAGSPDRIYLHAEIDAIVKLAKDDTWRAAYSMTIVRLTRKGKLGMARPCPVCMRALKELDIRWIEYTNGKGELVKEYINQ